MFEELRRRNVHRVAIAYLACAWLLVQVVETLLPAFEWPAQVLRLVLVLLAVGFVPALILAWIFEWTPEGFRRDTDMPSRTPRTASKYFDRLIAVVLVIAVTYFAIDKFAIDPARDRAEIAAATEEAAKRAVSDTLFAEFSDRSILVLPFLNMSSDPDQAYFADGISEELLNMLSRMDDLRVISRSTSWTFKDKEIDVAEIRQKLNVSHILEGAVRKAGNEVRITAQLIDARTDTHLWSETYDRTFNDVFAIQDEISLAVADRLHLELIVPGSPHEDVHPRAYELYLRARSDPAAGHRAVQPSEARRLLQDALDIEPDYLPAIYQLAYEYEQLRHDAFPQDEPVIRRTILELVERMADLAPDSVYASNWQAYIAMRWHHDLIAAAPHLENSMRYANRTDVHVWFRGAIELLHLLGRDEEAMVLARYWIDRDPACAGCLAGAAAAMRDAGRHEEAARIMESMLDWREADSAGYWNIGVAYLVAGDAEKALHYFDQIEDDHAGIDRDFARAFALYSLGRHEDFESILARRLSSQAHPEGIARLYAWSGQSNEAFEWLEKMVAQYGADYANDVKKTDLYEPIRSDPRWQEFLEKHGAVDKPIPQIDFNPDYPPVLQNAVDAVVANR